MRAGEHEFSFKKCSHEWRLQVWWWLGRDKGRREGLVCFKI